jgi:hypothetical protein
MSKDRHHELCSAMAKALVPFANVARMIDEGDRATGHKRPDDYPVYIWPDDQPLTLGDVRAARHALDAWLAHEIADNSNNSRSYHDPNLRLDPRGLGMSVAAAFAVKNNLDLLRDAIPHLHGDLHARMTDIHTLLSANMFAVFYDVLPEGENGKRWPTEHEAWLTHEIAENTPKIDADGLPTERVERIAFAMGMDPGALRPLLVRLHAAGLDVVKR